MRLTEIQLRVAVEAALTALEDAGVPRDHVLLGLTNSKGDAAGTLYETHVGATWDRDTAILLSLVADDLREEARRASQSLFGDDCCPRCGSPRWALRQARRDSRRGEKPGIYIEMWNECMDCDHKGPKR